MIVLGIDTSGTSTSAAVRTEEGVSSASAALPRGHARVLPSLLAGACQESGVGLADITHIAVARGPGLFTGMRVGLVTGQMLALAQGGAPIVGVSTLHAAAYRVVARRRPVGPFWVLLDARRREVFAQAFAPDGSPTRDPSPLSLAQALQCGAASTYLDAGAVALGIDGLLLDTEALAVEVAQLAAERWQRNEQQDPASALYLRRPDVTPAHSARTVLGRP